MSATTADSPTEALSTWARESGVSIDDDDALFEATAPGSRVLAIGEPGHGAQEPLALRNRLVRLLLRRGAIGAVALESGVLESRALDAYVQGGEGDATDVARAHMNWGFGRLDANVELLQILRRHNLAHGHDVHLYGFDIPGGDERGEVSGAELAPRVAARLLHESGRHDDVELARSLEQFGTALQRPLIRQLSDQDRAATRQLFDRVEARLAELGAPLAQPLAQDELAWARLAMHMSRAVFDMFCRWPALPPGLATVPAAAIEAMLDASGVRDAAMADNVSWIADRSPGRLVLVFAANGHVIGGRHEGGLWEQHPDRGLPAGHHLRARWGASYRVLLIASASTLSNPASPNATPDIDDFLASIGRDRFLLDLAGAPADRWLDSARSIGTNGPYVQAFVPRRAADLLVYFKTLHPASTHAA